MRKNGLFSSGFPQIGGIAPGSCGLAIGIQKNGVSSDGEDAVEVMGDDHDCRSQRGAQFQDEVIQTAFLGLLGIQQAS